MKKNSLIYAILTFLHIVLVIITFVKKWDKKPWILLFSSIGQAYVFEYVVLNILKSYKYYPKVFSNKWQDTILGAIISQAFTVPIMATALALFQKKWTWSLGATFLYAGIEWLFIRLGLFKKNWWKTIYTLISLPFFFWVVKKWSLLLEGKPEKWTARITVLLTFWVNYMNVNFVLVAISKKFLIRIKWSKKYYQHFIIAPAYFMIQSVIAYVALLTKKWALGLGTLHVMDQLLYRLNWIKAKRWTVYCMLPLHLTNLLLVKLFKKQMESGQEGT
ncbi:hypothetical protein [Heyndrickxia oleronia]|uniref:hypothetical protein n=1 Tax=Heyndrickxia oleronia TaxID=38875 RepID=UPI001B0EA96E|nr:hypothetical protein [Heyndrickxia oleronia]GIN40707.1 hypothetical protein J19TS1_36560 [Heyndrickxia oleronia]